MVKAAVRLCPTWLLKIVSPEVVTVRTMFKSIRNRILLRTRRIRWIHWIHYRLKSNPIQIQMNLSLVSPAMPESPAHPVNPEPMEPTVCPEIRAATAATPSEAQCTSRAIIARSSRIARSSAVKLSAVTAGSVDPDKTDRMVRADSPDRTVRTGKMPPIRLMMGRLPQAAMAARAETAASAVTVVPAETVEKAEMAESPSAEPYSSVPIARQQ